MTLREDFTGVGAGGHRNDHLALHRLYNSAVVVVPTGNAQTDTANLNAAFTAGRREVGAGSLAYGKRIILAPGRFLLNDTVVLRDVEGAVVEGSGYQTELYWVGNNAEKPVLALLHARQCTVCKLRISVATNNAAAAGIYGARDNAPSSPAVVPAKNIIRDVVIDCASGAANYGVMLGGLPGWADANNDFWHFENVQINTYGRAAFGLFGSQSYAHTLLNCHANGLDGTSDYGVYTGGLGGSFQWLGGSMSYNGVADFGVGRSYQPYIIQGYNSENSARLLEITDASYVTIHISGVRWSDLQLNSEDGRAINIPNTVGQSHLLIESSSIGEDFSPPYTPLALHVDPSNAADSSFVMTNVRIGSSLADPYTGMAPASTGVWQWTGRQGA